MTLEALAQCQLLEIFLKHTDRALTEQLVFKYITREYFHNLENTRCKYLLHDIWINIIIILLYVIWKGAH